MVDSANPRILVFGPAYADVVLRVEEPLLDEGVIDGSFEGFLKEDAEFWTIDDDRGHQVSFRLTALGSDLAGPPHRIVLGRQISQTAKPFRKQVRGQMDRLHLGGMGAGFAKALGGKLVSALGMTDDQSDPMSRFVQKQLRDEAIPTQTIWIEGQKTDWTLLVTSGPSGDKMAVGFRGCHSAVRSLASLPDLSPNDLVVVAGFSNDVVAQALRVPAKIRMLAPALRNMLDRDIPLSKLSSQFDVLCCNEAEWRALHDREIVEAATPVVAITQGPAGCRVSYRSLSGGRRELIVPAFPREAPPGDTNRAGEAFASTLIQGLMNLPWTPGPVADDVIESISIRAQAASALVLDRLDFGFPSRSQIDHVLQVGRVRRDDPVLAG